MATRSPKGWQSSGPSPDESCRSREHLHRPPRRPEREDAYFVAFSPLSVSPSVASGSDPISHGSESGRRIAAGRVCHGTAEPSLAEWSSVSRRSLNPGERWWIAAGSSTRPHLNGFPPGTFAGRILVFKSDNGCRSESLQWPNNLLVPRILVF